MRMSATTRRSRRWRVGATVGAAAVVVATAGAYLAPNAQATTIAYSGASTGAQSTVTIHRGDGFQRVLHPEATVTATLDDTSHTVTGGQVNIAPTYTDTFHQSFFNINLYVRTDMEQIGAATGTATPGATEGTSDLSVNATTRLRLTVFVTTAADLSQHPDTDQKLTDPAKCYVDLGLTLTGSANRRTGALSLGADPFTIPTFPNGQADPNQTCGLATGSLNQQVSGANNAISLNFSGGPTSAHYTGVTKAGANQIIVKKGDAIFEKKIAPTGSLVGDIDFTANKVTNVVTKFNPVDVAALPGVLSAFPANAHIDLSIQGTPAATLAPSATPGIDTINVQANAKMAVTVSLFKNPGIALTNPKTCFVTLKLNLNGTVDRGTDTVKLSQPKFTIPNFPVFNGCGLLLGPALSLMVGGSNNSIDLTFVDGVVPTAAK